METGHVDVRQMIREMGSRTQLLEWKAYWESEPIGERRRDWNTAQIVAALVNLFRNTKKSPKPFPTANFLLQFMGSGNPPKLPPKTTRDWRELKAIAIAMADMYNAENDRLLKRRQKKRHG